MPATFVGHVNHQRGLEDYRLIGGRYQVLRQLKQGDDTETLLATDLTHDTKVVIKTAAAAAFSASARMRLEHEAHVLSQIKQGLFAPLLDSGSEGDQVYLVMPFIPGITLQTRLRHAAAFLVRRIELLPETTIKLLSLVSTQFRISLSFARNLPQSL